MGRARRLLEAAAAGSVPEALIQDLAGAVLDQEPVRLALALAASPDDPHRVRRALELAIAVITSAEVAASAASAASGSEHA